MSPYLLERLAEERMHLLSMPGINKRDAPETRRRLAEIDHELSEGVGFGSSSGLIRSRKSRRCWPTGTAGVN